jgi:hypothetical protein
MADILEPVKVQELENATNPTKDDYIVIASPDSSKPPRKITLAELEKFFEQNSKKKMTVVGALLIFGGEHMILGGNDDIISRVARKNTGVWTVYFKIPISSAQYTILGSGIISDSTGNQAYVGTNFPSWTNTATDTVEIYIADDNTKNDGYVKVIIVKDNAERYY